MVNADGWRHYVIRSRNWWGVGRRGAAWGGVGRGKDEITTNRNLQDRKRAPAPSTWGEGGGVTAHKTYRIGERAPSRGRGRGGGGRKLWTKRGEGKQKSISGERRALLFRVVTSRHLTSLSSPSKCLAYWLALPNHVCTVIPYHHPYSHSRSLLVP